MTVSSDAERAEEKIRWRLDGTFRRMRMTDFGVEYFTETRPLDFIPDYTQQIKLARGNHE